MVRLVPMIEIFWSLDFLVIFWRISNCHPKHFNRFVDDGSISTIDLVMKKN
jgi:hypothetical protein